MECPQCSATLDLDEDELDEGDPVTCEECGASLTVASTNPIELEPVLEESEKEDDEDDDFEDDEEDDDLDDEEDEDADDEWS